MIGRALGRRGLVRCCLPALAAVVLVLLWPGASSAQGTKETLSTLQVVTHRGFRLSLKVTGNADASDEFSALSIELDKRSAESTESVAFRFTAGVTFAGSPDLSSAQINGHLLEGRGSINLAFSPTGAPSAVPVPKGCTGTPGSQRRGTLTGSLILNADRLGTVTLTAADATLAIPPSISECSGARSHRSQGTAIEGEAGRGGEGAYVFAFKPSRSGSAREGVTLFRAGDGFSFSWSFSALVPRSDYTFTSDLAGGRLTGVRGFHGTARYVGSPAHGGASHGRIAGNLWANFASLGAVRPFARLHLHADQFHISKP